MRDRREEILVRLLAILGTIEGIPSGHVYRNQAAFESPELLPAAVMLDGGETIGVSPGRRGMSVATTAIMTPQVFIVLRPSENETNEGVGEALSAFRVKLIRALRDDGPLQNIMGQNGYIEYRGITTDLQTGNSVEGQFQMDLAITYPFNPNEI